ncbi:MAG: PAS domain S-box protein [Deltaproteobacteria bacterium]|nr:PAS domain S-box protein [Deltaproteobacteria bacterium]
MFAALWIFFSDRLLISFADPATIARISTAKGLTFIAVTAVLLFLALNIVPPEEQWSAQPAEINIRTGPYRLLLAVLIPIIAFDLQWTFWAVISPYAWFLFFPAVFFSSWIGGLAGGMAATALSVSLVWFFFIPPQFSFTLEHPASIFSIGVFTGMGVLFSLIHERLRIAERKAADICFRCLVEQSLVGMYIVQKGFFHYVNSGFAEIFGYDSPAELIDLLPVRDLVAVEDRERVAENIRRHAAGEVTDMRYGFTGLRRDGSPIHIEAHGRAFSFNGKPAVIGIVLDVTERKQAEAKIHALNAELEHRVGQRTAELTAANRELDSFVYAVSHDLRAPLRAMSGFSQALVEDYGERLEGEARVFLDQITLAGRKMGELIDGLLTLSRSIRGELRCDTLDLSATAERLLAELSREEPERRVAWQVEPGLSAQGDARMIERVLYNLLANAWKFTARTAEPRIRVFAEADDGERLFCVADNGAGFDMAHAAKLFQPFQRLHRQDEFSGTGIGLATAQRIINRHGGVIRAEGSPGQGATFSFSLPLKSGGKGEQP